MAQRRCDKRLEAMKKAGEEYGRSGVIDDETYKEICSHIYPPAMYAHMADAGWGVTMEDFRESDLRTVEEVSKLGKKIDLIY